MLSKAGLLLFVDQEPLKRWMMQILCYLAVTFIQFLARGVSLISSKVVSHGSVLLGHSWYSNQDLLGIVNLWVATKDHSGSSEDPWSFSWRTHGLSMGLDEQGPIFLDELF